MIKETCSCGATLEYVPTGYNPVKEADTAKEWRRDHKHEPRTVAQESPKVSNEFPPTPPAKEWPDPPEPNAKPGRVI
jgi:hypothetical protein